MEPTGIVTPVKDPQLNRSKASILSKHSENQNPNSPLKKSGSKSKKSGSNNPNPNVNSPLLKNRIRERKFVVAKKSKRSDGLNQSAACKCSKGNGKSNKCLCVAYESLRASQEEFFKNRGGFNVENDFDTILPLMKNNEGLIPNNEIQKGCDGQGEEYGNAGEDGDDKNEGLIRKPGIRKGFEEKGEKYGNVGEDGDYRNEGLIRNPEIGEGCEEKVEEYGNVDDDGDHRNEGFIEMGVSAMKRSRDKLLEEVRKSVPKPGSGKVMGLIKAFENMKMEISNENDEKKGGLSGLQDHPPNVPETQLSSSSFCPSDLFLTSECLGLDSRRSSSLDSNRLRKSSESNGAFARRQWRKRQQLKTTTKPFKLRTEERGKCKEEEFMKKIQQMKEEEEKLRIPIAQGLPWTTDEPECLAKPPIKEVTRPVDLVLHSDVRAEERAEFDNQVAEKMSLIEQYRMERDRQQKLAEEEEIRRLRKELVPKAQPMPYFDRPFIPRRSEKQPTIPKEPKFHLAQNKKIKCMQQSWSDTSSYISI